MTAKHKGWLTLCPQGARVADAVPLTNPEITPTRRTVASLANSITWAIRRFLRFDGRNDRGKAGPHRDIGGSPYMPSLLGPPMRARASPAVSPRVDAHHTARARAISHPRARASSPSRFSISIAPRVPHSERVRAHRAARRPRAPSARRPRADRATHQL